MIWILLPVHNRKEITLKLVHCLASQSTPPPYHLLLIDDGCTDGTAEAVCALITNCTVIRGNGALYWGGALHQGYLHLLKLAQAREGHLVGAARESHNDIVLILNDDATFDSDFLAAGVRAIDKNPHSLVSATICEQNTRQPTAATGMHIDWRRYRFEPTANQPINLLPTRALFMHANNFLQLGGFHPHMLPHYLSDYEFTYRAWKRGWKLAVSLDLKIFCNTSTTGIHEFASKEMNAANFLQRLFSIRSAHNPIYFTTFLLLTCPWPWKGINILRVWWRVWRKLGQLIYQQILKKGP